MPAVGRRFIFVIVSFASLAGAGAWIVRVAGNANASSFEPALSLPTAIDLQPGDLIFRRGRSLVSDVVLSADQRTGYSHVGIVVSGGADPLIAHSEPNGESGLSGVTVAEPLTGYLRPEAASAYAIYRPQAGFAETGPAAARLASGYVEEATPFDASFDLSSDDEVYCTELVWLAYRGAGLDLAEDRRGRFRLGPLDRELVLPSSIQESPYLVRVYASGSDPATRMAETH